MKNPAHPGELILAIINEMSMTVYDAAESMDVSYQQLQNIISGHTSVTEDIANRLVKVVGSTAETWLRMQMNYDMMAANDHT